MSYWTYISGIIDVWTFGRTQHEQRYILETVLDHLPKVTGSEGNMNVHVVQKDLNNSWSPYNEFGEPYYPRALYPVPNYDYILVLEGALQDRMFDETLRELNNFLNRLAKRVGVNDILVRMKGWDRELIISDRKPYAEMFESYTLPDNSDKTNMPWAEYLMWESDNNSDYPKKLIEKYGKQFERRI